ncbi:MAG: hypothetical protein SFX18_02640 [Pirellulales bacterium]|nr:hypothetical protein [Pirellulales bacterium]
MRKLLASLILAGYAVEFGNASAASPAIPQVGFVRVKQAAKPAEEHAHPEHGPHGGDLIELGKEEYHVECVHDEKQKAIFFFLLDGEAKQLVAVPAAEIAINVKSKGRGKQYKVEAMPQKDDPKGTTTCFATKDATLIAVLEQHGIEAQLVIDIGNKQYRGKIAHDHDHAHEHSPKK